MHILLNARDLVGCDDTRTVHVRDIKAAVCGICGAGC